MQASPSQTKGGTFGVTPIAIGVMLIASSLALTYETIRLRAAWPPIGWPYSHEVPFVTPLMAGAHAEWRLTAGILTVWSVAYLFALLRLKSIQLSRSGALLLMALQCILLSVSLTNRLPFNSDQYVYVAYGDLVDAGLNPYAPPLKTQTGLPSSLAAISTVWSINEGSSDALQRIVVRDRYGPLFTLAAGAVLYPIRNLPVEIQAQALRIMAALACVACSGLLALWLLRTRGKALMLAAFTLSPAIVLQTAQGAHNDIYALLFAVIAAFALKLDRPLLATIAIAASIGIKITFAPLALPMIAYIIARRGLPTGIMVGACGAIFLALVAAPFGLEHALIQPIADLQKFNTPHVLGVIHGGMRHLPRSLRLSEGVLRVIYDAALIVCTFVITYRALRKEFAWTACASVLLLIYFAGNLEPWYVMILVPLLLMPVSWAMPLFIGTSLASQIFQGNDFIEQPGQIPIVPFLGLMVVLCGVAFALFDFPRNLLQRRIRVEST